MFFFNRFADVKAKIASKFVTKLIMHFYLHCKTPIENYNKSQLHITMLCLHVFAFSIPGKYHDLERQLIQEFTAAQRRGEIGRMREVAAVLLHFKVTWKNHFVVYL